jgi:hypothetical protein
MKAAGYVVEVTVESTDAADLQRLIEHWKTHADIEPLPDVVQVRVMTGTTAEAEALEWLRTTMGSQVDDMTQEDMAPVLGAFCARVDVLPAATLQIRMAVGDQTHTLRPRRVSLQLRGEERQWRVLCPPDPWDPPAHLLGLLRHMNVPAVRWYPAATEEQLRELVQRAATVDRPRAKTAPTAMLEVVAGVVTSTNKADHRTVRLKDGTTPQVHKRLAMNGTKVLGNTVQLQLQHGSQLYFDLDPTPALPHDAETQALADAVLQKLCRIFTDNMLRTFLSLLVSRSSDGTVLENYAQLAELRGWSAESLRSSYGARKKQLQHDIDALTQIRVVLKGDGQTVDMPLLVPVATVTHDDPKKKPRRWLQLNPKLARPLEAGGLVAAFDTRLLRVQSAVALQLGVWLQLRAAPSWTTHGLDHTHGRQRFKVTTMLEGAGIEWEPRLRKLGLPAFRQWVIEQLQELHATTGAAGPAIWYQYVPGADLSADDVETWQGAHIVAEQNSKTTKRRAKRDFDRASKAALPPATTNTLQNKATQTPPGA